MKWINRWQCKLRRAWWFINGGAGDGHSYIEEEVHHNKTVIIARCYICGKRDFIWGEKHLLDQDQ